MPKLMVEFRTKELVDLLSQLSPSELSKLMEELRKRMETFGMMKLAESAFTEWRNSEEDIYSE